MIVERWEFHIKHGKFNDARELVEDARKNVWPEFSARIYASSWGIMNTLVFDLDFEDMAEHDKVWDIVSAKEEWGPYLDKLFELTDGPVTHTLWDLL
jgi:hypothetical protein